MPLLPIVTHQCGRGQNQYNWMKDGDNKRGRTLNLDASFPLTPHFWNEVPTIKPATPYVRASSILLHSSSKQYIDVLDAWEGEMETKKVNKQLHSSRARGCSFYAVTAWLDPSAPRCSLHESMAFFFQLIACNIIEVQNWKSSICWAVWAITALFIGVMRISTLDPMPTVDGRLTEHKCKQMGAMWIPLRC